MDNFNIERRKYLRYDTEMKVYFHVKYDIKTRVKFKVLKGAPTHKYSGLCKNVSVEGLCFISKKKLNIGDMLLLEVYEPIVKGPVMMEGQVRWCKKLPVGAGKEKAYHTGVKLVLVNGRSVPDSIYLDKKYKVAWSAVLDSLFGNFAAMVRKLKRRNKARRICSARSVY
jgi:hypothetical protein